MKPDWVTRDSKPVPGMMIEHCFLRESALNSWERNFIDSIHKQLGDKGTLSRKQVQKLQQIYDDLTEGDRSLSSSS